ncbi:Cytochrome P450 monooxygenase BOA3 [Paramyrothecium foliicola]|nr:Cytochrome P450 monooxygenase BOA3 [Paramyrothecium foliicola]
MLALVAFTAISFIAYRLHLHPLASFRGPRLAAVSDWWFCAHWLSGQWPQTLETLQAKYGDVIRIAPNELVFASLEAARDIYMRCNPDHELQFIKDPLFYQQSEGSPTLVTETDPSAHRVLRKVVERGFSPSSIKEHSHIVERVADSLMCQLEDTCNDSDGVDMKTWSARYTFDVITEITFGRSSETVSQGKNTVWLDLLTGNIAAAAAGIVIRRQPHAVKVMLKFVFAKLAKKAQARSMYLSVLRKMCEQRLQEPPKAPNLFDNILMAAPPPAKDLQDDSYMTFLQGQAAALVSGGTETSSTLLSSLVYHLVTHPSHLKRLQDEVRAAFSSEKEITIESTKKLKYLQAVIEEALRIFPPVAFGLPRICPGATIAGVYVPKGAVITYLKDPGRVVSDEVVPDASLKAPRTKLVQDMRPRVNNFSLDTHGFQILHLPYKERNDKVMDDIQNKYFKEIEEVLREQIGVKHVFCFAPVLRPLDIPGKAVPNTQKTIPRPHLEFRAKDGKRGLVEVIHRPCPPNWGACVARVGGGRPQRSCEGTAIFHLGAFLYTMKLKSLLLVSFLNARCYAAFQGPFLFTQRTTHTAASPPVGFNKTFEQRYWIDLTRYSHGSPVVFVDGADKPGEEAVRLIEHGIVSHIADSIGAAVIVLEQRYYGQSFVTADLSTHHLQLLNTEESVADVAYFAQHFPYNQHRETDTSILPTNAPWISYGHWIAGTKGVLLRKYHPEQLWGAIASSAPILAIQNIWQYLEATRLRGDPLCIQVITTVVADIDDEIDKAGLGPDGEIHMSEPLAHYRELFNLTKEKTVRDFMNQVATPLGLWQRRSWDERQEDYQAWEYFCANLTQGISLEEEALGLMSNTHKADKVIFHEQAMQNYAKYIQHYLAVGHQRDPSETHAHALQPPIDKVQPFGEIRRNRTESQRTDLGQVWRLWYWQACTEWGYFSAAEPYPLPAMLSRSLSEFYLIEVCRFAFDFPDDYRVPVERINKHGNLTLHAPRLLFVNGEDDPWLDVTAHAPGALNLRAKLGDGYLLRQGGFANDRTALSCLEREPAEIQLVHEKEISTVKSWVAQWADRAKDIGEL